MPGDNEKVIFLAFKNPNAVEQPMQTFLTCRTCKNKTWKISEGSDGHVNRVDCAACGQHIGRIGWMGEDD